MYKAYVVLTNVGWSNARKYCEAIEGSILAVGYEKDILEILNYTSLCPPPDHTNGLVSVVDMSLFMDMCNNQEMYLDDYFISYVYVNVKSI